MSREIELENREIYNKINVISNKFRFRILELTQKQALSITELSSKLKLSYGKCADYVTILEKYGLIQKTKEGKEVKVSSKIDFDKIII
jgi:predicted transcriptional regulator